MIIVKKRYVEIEVPDVKKLLDKNKRQKDICKILDISSATASIIVNKINNDNKENNMFFIFSKDQARNYLIGN